MKKLLGWAGERKLRIKGKRRSDREQGDPEGGVGDEEEKDKAALWASSVLLLTVKTGRCAHTGAALHPGSKQ